MSRTRPSISVVMPCWNVSGWVRACLESVLAALPRDSEVLAVDDSSEDGTLDILRETAGRDGRVRVFSIPHSGVSAARNRGLDEAKGEYLFFVDPDDLVDKDFFIVMTSLMEAESADLAMCSYSVFEDGGDGATVCPLKGCYNFTTARGVEEGLLSRLFGYSFEDVRNWHAGRALFTTREMAFSWRCAYRRSIAEGLRFDTRLELNEDAMFLVRYLSRCARTVSIDRPLYLARSRAGSAVKTVTADAERAAANKAALLEVRKSIVRESGGRFGKYCAATHVLALLEIVSWFLGGRLSLAAAREAAGKFMCDETVAASARGFPLGFRKPLLSLAVVFVRIAMSFIIRRRGK